MLSLLYRPTLTSVHDYWKNHSFEYTDLFGKSMSLLFNTLSIFAIVFLPRRLSFNFMAAVTIAVTLEPKKIKSATVSTFLKSSIYHEKMGSESKNMFLEYWVLSQVFHSRFVSLQWMMLDLWSPKIYPWGQGQGLITRAVLCSRILLKWKLLT